LIVQQKQTHQGGSEVGRPLTPSHFTLARVRKVIDRLTAGEAARPLLSRTTLVPAALLVILLVGGINLGQAAGSTQPPQFVTSTSIVISEDGNAAINQTLTMPQNATLVTVPLLASQVGDILVVNQSNTAFSYLVSNENITIYTLGSTRIYLSYDTDSLTSKTGSVWTLDFTWGSNSTLVLPAQSTILSLSSAPLSISAKGGSPVLILGPGAWDISYGLTLTGPSSSSTTSGSATSGSSTGGSTTASGGSTSTTASASGNPSQSNPSSTTYELALVIVAGVAAAAAGLALWRRRRPGRLPSESLRPDDLEMLRFIRDRGGKVVEAEIRERFSVPRTSAWRQTKRLEQLGYLRIRKVGSQNQLELVRDDFDQRPGS